MQYFENNVPSKKSVELSTDMIASAVPDEDPEQVRKHIEFSGDDSEYRRRAVQYERDAFEYLRKTQIGKAIDGRDAEGFSSAAFMDPYKLAKNAETILEERYAERIVDTAEIITGFKPADVNRDMKADLESTTLTAEDIIRDWGEDKVFNLVIADQILFEADKEDTDNPIGDIVDFAQNILPQRRAALLSNEVASDEFTQKFAELTGTNLMRQYEFLWALPKEERKAVLRATYEKIKERSLDDAQEYVERFKMFTEQAAFEQNLATDFFDALDIIGLGKLAVATFKGLKGTVRGAARRNRNIGITEEMGDGAGSAAAHTIRNTDPSLSPVQREAGGLFAETYDFENAARQMSDTQGITTGARVALQVHLMTSASEVAEKLSSALSGAARMSPVDLKNAILETQEEIRRNFKGVRFLNFAPQTYRRADTNTYRLSMYVGRGDGELFESIEGAKTYAKDYVGIKTDDFVIQEYGSGSRRTLESDNADFLIEEVAPNRYAIRIDRDVDESKGLFRTLREKPIEKDERFATGRFYSIVGRLLGEQAGTAKGVHSARLAATHGATDWYKTFEVIAKPYFNLRKDSAQEVAKALTFYRDRTARGQNMGWPKTGSEFIEDFTAVVGKAPTEAQETAFWSYKFAMDVEKELADLGRHAAYVQLGARRVSVSSKKPRAANQVSAAGQDLADEMESLEFNGVATNKETFASERMQKNSEFARVVVVRADGTRKVLDNKRNADEINDLLGTDQDLYRVVEGDGIKVDGKRAHYVISERGAKVSNLKREHTGTGYAGGHHLIHEHPFYVKLGRFDSDGIFDGEDVLVNAFSRTQAKKIADNWNEAMDAYLDGDVARARSIQADRLPFMAWEDFEKAMVGARKDVRASATRVGERWTDVAPGVKGNRAFNFSFDNMDMVGNYQRRFAESRAPHNLKVMREEADQKWVIEDAPTLDPGQALQAGAKAAIDYRIRRDALVRGVNAWTKQFSSLTSWNPERIQNDVIGFLSATPEDLFGKMGKDHPDAKLALMARDSILRQMSDTSWSARKMATLRDHVLESYFNDGGKSRFRSAAELILEKDPVTFMRKLAYTAHLGVGNITQFVVQGSSTAMLAAISPRYYLQGISSAMALKSAMYSTRKGIHLHIGKHFSKFTGLSADEFAQMASDLRTSGWSNMGGSMAQIADELHGGITSSVGAKAGEWSRIIPSTVDRFHRHSSYAVAWMEAKKKYKTTKFDQFQLAEILDRADALSFRMSSANNPAYAKGVASPITQFATFPLRVFEELWGGLVGKGNLSRGEVARLIAAHTLLFGVADGPLGLMTGPFNFGIKEFIYQSLWDAEIDTENPFIKLALEGGLNYITEQLTGYDQDFSRLSLGGEGLAVKALKYLSGEEALSDGAPGPRVAMDAAAKTGSIVARVWNEAVGGAYGSEDLLTLLAEDFDAAFRIMASYDNFAKLRAAVSRGVYENRRGEAKADIDWQETTLSILAGSSPREVTQQRMKENYMLSMNASRGAARKEVEKAYRMAIRAEDKDATARWLRIAVAIGNTYNIPSGDLTKAWAAAQRNSGVSADRVATKWTKFWLEQGKTPPEWSKN